MTFLWPCIKVKDVYETHQPFPISRFPAISLYHIPNPFFSHLNLIHQKSTTFEHIYIHDYPLLPRMK